MLTQWHHKFTFIFITHDAIQLDQAAGSQFGLWSTCSPSYWQHLSISYIWAMIGITPTIAFRGNNTLSFLGGIKLIPRWFLWNSFHLWPGTVLYVSYCMRIQRWVRVWECVLWVCRLEGRITVWVIVTGWSCAGHSSSPVLPLQGCDTRRGEKKEEGCGIPGKHWQH